MTSDSVIGLIHKELDLPIKAEGLVSMTKKRKGLLKTKSLKEINVALRNFDFHDAMEKHRKSMEREKVREDKALREQFVRSAMKAGFSRSMIKFLIENFADIGHRHWGGRIGGS